MKKKYQVFLVLAIVLAMLLCSGCSRNKSANTYRETGTTYYEDAYADYGYMDYEEEVAYAVSDSASGSYASKSYPAAANSEESPAKRMVRKSASINIQVMDPIQAAEEIIAMTEQMGGFVISYTNSQEYYSSDIYLPKADLSIRVPSDRLLEMLDTIENLTTDKTKYVTNKRIYGVDITSDYVDSNSRLASLEKTLEKLYEILDTAENAEEALDVYNNIADVESDIEVLKGQLKYMEESVALSSVDIKITSVRPAPIQTVQKWEPGEVVKDAFENLLDTGKTVIEGLIYFVIVGIPILALIALPIVLIVLIIKSIVKKNKAKKAARGGTKDVLTEVKEK